MGQTRHPAPRLIAIVNVSRWRCDALIVTPQGVRSSALRDLTLDAVLERTNAYLATLQHAELAVIANDEALTAARRDPRPATIRNQIRSAAAALTAAERADAMLRDTQEWMWDTIAGPVLDELGFTEPLPPTGPWPRLWWCPTGPLTLLPVHTAGYHQRTGEGVPRTVLDRVVSSYTPTVRALSEARSERDHADTDQDRFLIVTVKDAPGQPVLHAVDRERAALQALLPAHRYTTLDGPAATRDAVDQALGTHRWVHFSCHGDQNLAEPSLGGLLLHDGTL
jgi:hypothetical protein